MELLMPCLVFLKAGMRSSSRTLESSTGYRPSLTIASLLNLRFSGFSSPPPVLRYYLYERTTGYSLFELNFGYHPCISFALDHL